MKHTEKLLLIGAFLLVFSASVWVIAKLYGSAENSALSLERTGEVLGARIDVRGEIPQKSIEEPVFPVISKKLLEGVKAKSFIVFDLGSGQTLAEKDITQKLPIASLTKLMTAYVAYFNMDLSKYATVTPKSLWTVSPRLGIISNDALKIEDLFNSMLIGSANDAGFALAQIYEKANKSNFVEKMNTEAESLGMVNSSFSNPVGFDSDNNFSTAEDLKVLIGNVFKLPAFKNLSRRTSYEFESGEGKFYKIPATNKLIQKYPDVLAIKTGYTKNALGSMASVVEYNGRETVIIVLDTVQRETDTLLIRRALLDSEKITRK